MRRRAVASFEEPVKQISGTYGRIDLFWKGMLLVEHKSRGEDLGKAESQAFDYIQDLLHEGREDDVPRYVIVSDFARFALYDLEPEDERPLPLFAGHRVETTEFALAGLAPHYSRVRVSLPATSSTAFRTTTRSICERSPSWTTCTTRWRRADTRAMILNDSWCGSCSAYSRSVRASSSAKRFGSSSRTAPSPTARIWGFIWSSFSPCSTRLRTSGRRISMKRWLRFPYVNGDLFAERLGFADFNRDMRNSLLGLHAVRLVADFAGHFRLAVSGNDGTARSGGNSAATTRANATFSKSCGGCFWTTCGRSSSGSRATRTNSSNSTRRLPAFVSSTRPAVAAIFS